MSDKIQLEIVTPTGSVFSAEVDSVTAPGKEGEFGVMPGHALYVTTLRAGLLTVEQNGANDHFFVGWGYAEAGPKRVTILADSAEHISDIDVERAIEARKRAEERLRKQEALDEARAEAALERAAARIHIAGTFRK